MSKSTQARKGVFPVRGPVALGLVMLAVACCLAQRAAAAPTVTLVMEFQDGNFAENIHGDSSTASTNYIVDVYANISGTDATLSDYQLTTLYYGLKTTLSDPCSVITWNGAGTGVTNVTPINWNPSGTQYSVTGTKQVVAGVDSAGVTGLGGPLNTSTSSLATYFANGNAGAGNRVTYNSNDPNGYTGGTGPSHWTATNGNTVVQMLLGTITFTVGPVSGSAPSSATTLLSLTAYESTQSLAQSSILNYAVNGQGYTGTTSLSMGQSLTFYDQATGPTDASVLAWNPNTVGVTSVGNLGRVMKGVAAGGTATIANTGTTASTAYTITPTGTNSSALTFGAPGTEAIGATNGSTTVGFTIDATAGGTGTTGNGSWTAALANTGNTGDTGTAGKTLTVTADVLTNRSISVSGPVVFGANGRVMVNQPVSGSVTLTTWGDDSNYTRLTVPNSGTGTDGVIVVTGGQTTNGNQLFNGNGLSGTWTVGSLSGYASSGPQSGSVTLATSGEGLGSGETDPCVTINYSTNAVANRQLTVASTVAFGRVLQGYGTSAQGLATIDSATGQDAALTRVSLPGTGLTAGPLSLTVNGGAGYAYGSGDGHNDAQDSTTAAVTGLFTSTGNVNTSATFTPAAEGLGGESPLPVTVNYTADVVQNRVISVGGTGVTGTGPNAGSVAFGRVMAGTQLPTQTVSLTSGGDWADNTTLTLASGVYGTGPVAASVQTTTVFDGTTTSGTAAVGGTLTALGAQSGTVYLPTTGEGLAGEAGNDACVAISYTATVLNNRVVTANGGNPVTFNAAGLLLGAPVSQNVLLTTSGGNDQYTVANLAAASALGYANDGVSAFQATGSASAFNAADSQATYALSGTVNSASGSGSVTLVNSGEAGVVGQTPVNVTVSYAWSGAGQAAAAANAVQAAGGALQDAFGPALTASVAAGGSYANLSSSTTASGNYVGSYAAVQPGVVIGTTATILASTAAKVGATVSMEWRARTGGEVWNPATWSEDSPQGSPVPSGYMGLLSDVVEVDGIAEGDLYVIQMSYDPGLIVPGKGLPTGFTSWEAFYAATGNIVLAYLNPATGMWTNAVRCNTGDSATAFIDGAYNPDGSDFVLGDYGVDTATHTVWAVVNYDAQFAVLPEPGTLAILVLGAAATILRRRR